MSSSHRCGSQDPRLTDLRGRRRLFRPPPLTAQPERTHSTTFPDPGSSAIHLFRHRPIDLIPDLHSRQISLFNHTGPECLLIFPVPCLHDVPLGDPGLTHGGSSRGSQDMGVNEMLPDLLYAAVAAGGEGEGGGGHRDVRMKRIPLPR